MKFAEKLQRAVTLHNSLVCVGLDSDTARLPGGATQLEFNKAIIDATHDVVAAYKPNTAFYEAEGAAGIAVLEKTCAYIRQVAPETLIILDAKRADIGNTNNGYVRFAVDYLGVDAITLHPYLGSEALSPFLALPDTGLIVLCRTSNPGSGELQDLMVDAMPLYEKVAHAVSEQWNTNANCMLVVGATYPDEAAKIRAIVGDDLWFLIPGVGAQGGNVEKTVRAAKNSRGDGMLISSSRDIIFASSGDDFAAAARAKAIELRDQINAYRSR